MKIVVEYSILAFGASILNWAAVLLVLGAGLILAYHWFRFARSPLFAFTTLAIYATGSLIMLSILFSLGPTLLL